jgi:hypothetical protein
MKRIQIAALVLLLTATLAERPAHALPPLFSENFDGLSLGPPVDETWTLTNAFTHSTPPGWTRDASGVPGVGDPDVGVTEWEGWSFADKKFWNDVDPREGRELFDLGQGTIAVADSDEWNDLGDPANNIGFYKTLLKTPLIDMTSAIKLPVKLIFDSSWKGGCCDDGERFNPDWNNQTAILRMYPENGPSVVLRRWESAPFKKPNGKPSTDPSDPPNDDYKEDALNEHVVVDVPPGTTKASFEFGVEGAGDDGWWAVDNTEVVPLSTILGDMNINDVLDPGDFSAFALGLRSTSAYRAQYFGEFPVTRGSADGVFDFDDIAWFLNIMGEGGGLPSGAGAAATIGSIPEPSVVALFFIGIAALSVARKRVQR